ncbi:MAG: DUF4012 domain-containing protein [Candidatus Moranbacteria bacterium]|nr:DUF4012 domain-containing protein [Candidatus Moranbacteria bacterium]
MENKNKNIIPQMFDVRPVNNAGDLDLEKIQSVETVISVSQPLPVKEKPECYGILLHDIVKTDAETYENPEIPEVPENFETPVEIAPVESYTDNNFNSQPALQREALLAGELESPAEPPEEKAEIHFSEPEESVWMPPSSFDFDVGETDYFGKFKNDFKDFPKAKIPRRSLKEYLPSFSFNGEKVKNLYGLIERYDDYARSFRLRKKALVFAYATAAVFLIFFGIGIIQKSLSLKNSAMTVGQSAFADLTQAKDEALQKNFQQSALEFKEAYQKFDQISSEMGDLGNILAKSTRFIPFLSKAASGSYLVEAGKDISKIGELSGNLLAVLDGVKNPMSGDSATSLLSVFQDVDKNSREVLTLLTDAKNNLNEVNVADIPDAERSRFTELKNKLPEAENFLRMFVDNSQIFTDVLGGNGPRKYLFLFQNNQEMRATVGFIGSYGVLDMSNGHVKKFFIDGIFNPDGQLKEKVVPPIPIQKMSAVWTLHDSNWFPDFPTSAEKAMWFFDKTGGPTVDGVIAMTPTVMQKLLEVTGPIAMPDYGVTIDKDNFVEAIQYETEVDFDKELNQPKKILADMAPLILEKIFNMKNVSDLTKTMNVLAESLKEKHMLLYSKNYEIEKRIAAAGWSGEILDTPKDYLSVINTNINGYKTDGVVDESIGHEAQIQDDGSIIDTVTVTRHHRGGNMNFDWWNKVNADYLRVYVPKGSTLLSAEGQTREFNAPPIDYQALGFRIDAQVQMEEQNMQIDDASGTRIYDDGDKTVFANWAYVSPQETVTLKYKYLLPFKINVDSREKPADTYSLLVQKQSGSIGSRLASQIIYPEKFKSIWRYPDDLQNSGEGSISLETNLKLDRFMGVALSRKE